jgi:hypothetical protein
MIFYPLCPGEAGGPLGPAGGQAAGLLLLDTPDRGVALVGGDSSILAICKEEETVEVASPEITKVRLPTGQCPAWFINLKPHNRWLQAHSPLTLQFAGIFAAAGGRAARVSEGLRSR